QQLDIVAPRPGGSGDVCDMFEAVPGRVGLDDDRSGHARSDSTTANLPQYGRSVVVSLPLARGRVGPMAEAGIVSRAATAVWLKRHPGIALSHPEREIPHIE